MTTRREIARSLLVRDTALRWVQADTRHTGAKAAEMKTVLFCGGLGTRIRDVSESVPKPMIPIGDKPILWHLMHYYSQFGYKANVIKEYFLNYKPQTYADCVVTGFGNQVEILGGDPQQDWRIAMIDTG